MNEAVPLIMAASWPWDSRMAVKKKQPTNCVSVFVHFVGLALKVSTKLATFLKLYCVKSKIQAKGDYRSWSYNGILKR